MPATRRAFLKYSLLAASSALFARVLPAVQHEDAHRRILEEKFSLARGRKLAARPLGEVVATVGASFLGAPYKAHTLETPGAERLVVNLREFDCVTFVESVLAIARCIKLGDMTWEAFTAQLTVIRYRNGVLSGYASRLHYFSDWIADNERKHIVRNVARALGGVKLCKTINYMTTHRSAYPRLADDIEYAAIQRIEDELNDRTQYYLPTAKVRGVADRILDGDIIGITTTLEGLDVAHTGFAYRSDGALRFLHAPLSAGTIQISTQPLVAYLSHERSRTGIMIARPVFDASSFTH